MHKSFFAFILLCFLASNVFAQNGFTTVSGTITDPNGIPWAGGTITAQLITAGGTTPTLNGQPFTSTNISGLLGPTGSFTMRLGDSGLIVPSTTTWQFIVAISPGVLPPAGKGPQSFTVTTAINCGTNTPAACASNAMNITAALVPVPALTFVSGGGTPGGSSGQLQFNNGGVFGGLTPVVGGQGSLSVNPAGIPLAITGTAGVTPAVAITGPTSGNVTELLLTRGVAGVTNPVLSVVDAGGSGPGIQSFSYATNANCSSSASPAVCGTAAAGSVVIAAAASTVQVNTTQVTANSQILLTRDDSLGAKLSVTCNTATAAGDIKISARTGGTSFTITVQNSPATNPLCLSYSIVN